MNARSGDATAPQARVRQSPLSGRPLSIEAWVIGVGRYPLECEIGYVLKLNLVHCLGPRSVKGVAYE
jgi:hypothetical protein